MSTRGQTVFVMSQVAGFLRSLSLADGPLSPIAKATAQSHAHDLDEARKLLAVEQCRPPVRLVSE